MEILSLPDTIQSKYISLSGRMKDSGANLGLPHTKALGEGLFELRIAKTRMNEVKNEH
ncbi:MAG: type II toxin-antitoxin system RelE/ParE family toxin [Methylococcales bacterium]|jgi:hypothetical protein|nr:type II toxin-antitoxin system RelE/ParE family toxin [Methylococcales bacterium]